MKDENGGQGKKNNNNKKIGENEKLLKIRFLGGWGVGGNTN